MKKLLALFCLLMTGTLAVAQKGKVTPLISKDLPDILRRVGVYGIWQQA